MEVTEVNEIPQRKGIIHNEDVLLIKSIISKSENSGKVMKFSFDNEKKAKNICLLIRTAKSNDRINYKKISKRGTDLYVFI